MLIPQSLTNLNVMHRIGLLGSALVVSLLCYVIVIIVYRLYFHPLAKYPGPWLAKVTSLHDFYIACKEHRAQHFGHLHDVYGPIVRYTPNELSFNSVKAFQDIYGFKGNVRKTDAMASTQSDPETMSTFSEIYKAPALKKRKVLSQGFSESALREAEEYIIGQINVLCRCLLDPSTERVKDMSLWLNYLAYDIMGEVVFGKSFDMMTENKERFILPLIDNMVFSMLLGGIIPTWFKWGIIDKMFPQVYHGRMAFIDLSERMVAQRLSESENEKGDRRDFFYHLLKHRDPETGKQLSRKMLLAEGVLLITAGSDTTSTGLAGTLFYILKYPRCLTRLQQELDSVFNDVSEIRTGAKLTSCTYLRACVDEGLRLAPPGPGMPPRTILDGGMMIDGGFFPAGVNVGGAAWTYAYNPANFPDPELFRPERYLFGEGDSDERVEKAKNSYWPFQTGVRKCPGMKMAYQELYLTIARMVYLCDITPEHPEEMKANFEILDHFNVKKKGPFCSFKLRSGRTPPL